MGKTTHLLQIHDMRQTAFSRVILDGGILIGIPEHLVENFARLADDDEAAFFTFEATTPAADLERIKQEHSDCDVYCLAQRTTLVRNYVSMCEFALSDDTTNAIAFVCIPRDTEQYIQSPAKYLRLLETVMADCYNRANVWMIACRPNGAQICAKHDINDEKALAGVVANDYCTGEINVVTAALDAHYDNQEIQKLPRTDWFDCIGVVRYTGEWDTESEKVFERCRAEFGFPQDHIDEIKNIISTHSPMEDCCSYDIIDD